jgi:hypothetical protein
MLSGASTAPATTIRTQWVDKQPWAGGQIVYRTTKIWVRDDRFAVTTTITNRTLYGFRFEIVPGESELSLRGGSFGIAWRDPSWGGIIQERAMHDIASSHFSRPLPKICRPGKTITVTFTGRSRLLRTHREWWVVYGLVLAAPGKRQPPTWEKPSYWLSARTFKS